MTMSDEIKGGNSYFETVPDDPAVMADIVIYKREVVFNAIRDGINTVRAIAKLTIAFDYEVKAILVWLLRDGRISQVGRRYFLAGYPAAAKVSR